jgi:G3E family GTPase
MLVNPICGFLGSGKTTLLRRILTERVGREKLALIVNEFGAVGVDGAILSGQSVDMVELTAGCLCCTLRGSLISALEELRDSKRVERVVIESTGVAQPAEMLEVLAAPSLASSVTVGPVVTVVDAARFPALRNVLGGFYVAQVERADVILLNKTDLVDFEQLERLRSDVKTLNPRATVATTERCDVELRLVLDRTPGALEPSALEQGLPSPAPSASFVSFVVPATFDADEASVKTFFGGLPSDLVRAKGFMTIEGLPCLVQFAAGQLEITPASNPRSLSIVFISSGTPDRAAVEAGLKATARG